MQSPPTSVPPPRTAQSPVAPPRKKSFSRDRTDHNLVGLVPGPSASSQTPAASQGLGVDSSEDPIAAVDDYYFSDEPQQAPISPIAPPRSPARSPISPLMRLVEEPALLTAAAPKESPYTPPATYNGPRRASDFAGTVTTAKKFHLPPSKPIVSSVQNTQPQPRPRKEKYERSKPVDPSLIDLLAGDELNIGKMRSQSAAPATEKSNSQSKKPPGMTIETGASARHGVEGIISPPERVSKPLASPVPPQRSSASQLTANEFAYAAASLNRNQKSSRRSSISTSTVSIPTTSNDVSDWKTLTPNLTPAGKASNRSSRLLLHIPPPPKSAPPPSVLKSPPGAFTQSVNSAPPTENFYQRFDSAVNLGTPQQSRSTPSVSSPAYQLYQSPLTAQSGQPNRLQSGHNLTSTSTPTSLSSLDIFNPNPLPAGPPRLSPSQHVDITSFATPDHVTPDRMDKEIGSITGPQLVSTSSKMKTVPIAEVQRLLEERKAKERAMYGDDGYGRRSESDMARPIAVGGVGAAGATVAGGWKSKIFGSKA